MTASLQAVVGTYSALVQEGNSWRADCPACGVNRLIVTDALLCLECGWGGYALAYLMLVEHCTEDEARARLANGEFQEPPPEPRKPRPRMELVGTDDVPEGVEGWHCYRNAAGEPVAYTDGQAWRTHGRLGPHDPPRWYKRQPEPPRPLYGLDRLHVQKRVIVCESEAEADAAARLWPLNPCVAWACGQHAHAGADWTVLAGRAVLLVPRNDEASRQAMRRVAALLLQDLVGCTVSGIDTSELDEGWTLCDAADWTPEQALTWAKGRIVEYPQPLTASQQVDILQDNAAEGGDTPNAGASGPDAVTGGAHPPNAPQSPVSDAAEPDVSDMPPALEFPPEATVTKPKRPRKPRLVGGTEVDGNTVRVQEIEPDTELPPEFSEGALCERFAAQHGEDWRHCAEYGKFPWLAWDGVTWIVDRRKRVTWAVYRTCRRAARDAQGSATPAARIKMTSLAVVNHVLGLTSAHPDIAITQDAFNVSPDLLGTPGGVVDLRTGHMVEARREDYITQRTAVAPAAGEPTLWLRHLALTVRDDDTIAFLRRYCGYMLTGHTREHQLVFCYGTGRNGKGTIIETIVQILGQYGYAAPVSLLMESKNERHPVEVAMLRDMRGVSCSEPPDGARFDDSRIRQMTGGDTQTARKMGQDFSSFKPTHKFLLMGNHKPALRVVDEAIRARFRLIEFGYTIPAEDRDTEFADKLRAEWPQILQWCIDGAVEWYQVGVGVPEEIQRATDAYLAAEDTFQQFIDERCDVDKAAVTKSGDAYRAYREFCEAAGEFVHSQKRFSQKMQDRGYKLLQSAAGRMICGFRLRGVAPTSKPVQGVDDF